MITPSQALAVEGTRLTSTQALALQRLLLTQPFALDIRLKLLGHYWLASTTQEDARKVWAEIVLWLIKYYPFDKLLSTPFCQMDKNDPGFEEATSLWTNILESHDRPLALIGIAADFFFTADPEKSKLLLERGETIDPASPEWSSRLARIWLHPVLLSRECETCGILPPLDNSRIKQASATALGHANRSLGKTSTPDDRIEPLRLAGEASLECGNEEQALLFASEAITLANNRKHLPHIGYTLHSLYIICGLVESNRHRFDAAHQYLAKAAEYLSAPDSVLSSFGPDLRLAHILLKAGLRREVLIFLEQCQRLWRPHNVSRWIEAIRRGETPPLSTRVIVKH